MQRKHTARPIAALVALALFAGAPGLASAAVTDLSNTPLASSSSNLVKPNVSFVLDTSGSMAWSHAPDESQPMNDNIGYRSSHCNSIYYDPTILYPPARHADGTSFSNSSFTAAWTDGIAATGSVNLSTSFYAFDNTSSFGAGTDGAQGPAYYYVYTGSQVPSGANYQNSSSTFYTECSYPLGKNTGPTATLKFSGSSTTSVSSIKVNGVEMMSGTSSSSSSSSTEASNVAAKITQNGFLATASGSTVTITGPNTAAGLAMVITKSGSMTLTPTAFAPFQRITVNSTSGPGSTDERTNFANWFSYYRIRILMMKSGAGRAFVGIGSSYRVGFMTIYTTPSSSSDPGYLSINDFTTTQKNSFFSKLYAQSPGGGTPLKQALSEAALNIAGKEGPDPVQYSCQQNFIILSTDGYWNSGTPNGVRLDGSTSIGNQDNTSATPRPMYDGGGTTSSNTLADVAAYYYNTDLKTSALGACNTGVSGADVCANNVPISGVDNAPWQHITLFTLGLGVNGLLNYDNDYLNGGSADYNAIVGGSKNWPTPTGDTLTTIDDLWHAAVNGHGQYFSAKNPDLLVSGLSQALAGVSAREAAGAAAATSNLEPVSGDNFIFLGSYRTQKWDGEVEARTLDPVTGAVSATPLWSAQAQLDAQISSGSDTRTIFTFLGGAKVSFVPASFSSAQKTSWFTPSASPALSQAAGWTAAQTANATADNLINYLRGQNGNEELGSNASANQLFRVRDHVLGDVIDARPVYEKIPPFQYTENNYAAFKSGLTRAGVVYVAANDGMLHAFDANSGNELWAYIPSSVLPNLKLLADDAYAANHRYFVDGSPTVSDIYDGSTWHTILVGGLNAGGKSVYALDVTNPLVPLVLWEFTDANLGFTFGTPQIGKLTNGTWVVAFSSGYNNADGVGRVYVVNAKTGVLQFTVSTGVGTAGTPSGLGKLAGWADNSLIDNTMLRIYGGDMLGNLWRFDLNDIIPPSGKEATQLAFFQAGSYQQPITTSPELGIINSRFVVFVGTGRYLGASDLSDTNQQSLYAIRDDLAATGIGNARTETSCPLIHQTLTVIDANNRSTSQTAVNWATNCGWYLDFNPSNQTPGERINIDPLLQLGVLIVGTNIPEQSVCSVGGSSFIYFFDYTTGQFVSTSTGQVAGTRFGSSILVGISEIRTQDGRDLVMGIGADTSRRELPVPPNPLVGAIGRRVQWRELLN
jgi:type IV pilus assembly protein PilY1